jgi:hypothetical protein
VEPVRHRAKHTHQHGENGPGSGDHGAEEPTKIGVVVAPDHIQPSLDPIHAIVRMRKARFDPLLEPIHTAVQSIHPIVYLLYAAIYSIHAAVELVHTTVCPHEPQFDPMLDPLERRSGRTSKLLQRGNPRFHIHRVSVAATRLNRNVRHRHRSTIDSVKFAVER